MGKDANGPAARRFARVVAAIHGVLPGLLKRIPQTFIGFALINSFTFGVDMLLLWLSHGVLKVPYPVAVSFSFGVACTLAFLLNRTLNFRSHGDIGAQSGKYLFVMISNYLLWILLFSSFLEFAGVPYPIARVLAACVEGIYIYLLSRLWVFRRPQVTAGQAIASRPVHHPADAEARSRG